MCQSHQGTVETLCDFPRVFMIPELISDENFPQFG